MNAQQLRELYRRTKVAFSTANRKIVNVISNATSGTFIENNEKLFVIVIIMLQFMK